MKMGTIKSLVSVSARLAAGVGVVAAVVNTPLALGAVIAAGLIRTDEEKRSDRFCAICDGHWVSGKGKDGRSWRIVREGDGYIVQAGKGSPALQYFRPEQGRTWSRGEAADRLVELADVSAVPTSPSNFD